MHGPCASLPTQRIGRRLLGEVVGHSVQASTRRSPLSGRCLVAQR